MERIFPDGIEIMSGYDTALPESRQRIEDALELKKLGGHIVTGVASASDVDPLIALAAETKRVSARYQGRLVLGPYVTGLDGEEPQKAFAPRGLAIWEIPEEHA